MAGLQLPGHKCVSGQHSVVKVILARGGSILIPSYCFSSVCPGDAHTHACRTAPRPAQVFHEVDQHPECVMEVMVANRTRTDSHKFKVRFL